LSPLDPDVELELAGLADVLAAADVPELAELPEPAEVPEPDVAELLPCFADAADVLLCVAEEAVVWACAALARPTAMPPPARTLAAPMAAVMARRRPWPRSRATTAASTLSLPVSTPDRPSAGRAPTAALSCQHDPPTSAGPLPALRGRCELRSWTGQLWMAVWMSRWKATGDRG
jgi:hypothetical protein